MKIARFISIIFFAITLLASCSKDNSINGNDPITNQSISGAITVYNSKLKLGVGDNVTVELHKSGEKVKSTTSDKNGKYSLTNVPEGIYTIVMSKKGYYNEPTRKVYLSHSLYTVKKDTTITADLKLYKKATASIETIVWRQGSKAKGDDSNGVVLDIKFKDLNLSEVDKYVFIYLFAGYNDQISKANCKEKIDQADGNGWVMGYGNAWILKNRIVNNEVKGYWDSRVCGWLGGSIKAAKCPSHMAVYVANCISAGADGLFGDDYVAVGDNYSGVGDIRLLKKY